MRNVESVGMSFSEIKMEGELRSKVLLDAYSV